MLEELFHKTKDGDGATIIVKVRLPAIDARDAKRRCPHIYSATFDGFAAKAPPGPPAFNPQTDIVGASGGKPALAGGVGFIEVVTPHKAPAA